MTEDEQARYRQLGRRHEERAGTWIGWTIVVPLTFGVMQARLWRQWAWIAVGMPVAVVGVVRLVRLDRSARREVRAFLASTEWARAATSGPTRSVSFSFDPESRPGARAHGR
jgi:hypothetical protein